MLILSRNKLERIILLIYISYILILYPLINILVKGQSALQMINRILLIVITMISMMLFKEELFRRRPKFIDTLIIITSLYITISLLLFYSYSNQLTIMDMFKEILYTILPFFIYFMGISVAKKHKVHVIKLMVYNILVSIALGAILYFNLRPIIFANFINILKSENKFLWQFGSIYGVIIMGYLSQLMYALVLFNKYSGKYKRILLIIFLGVSILTLQRSAFIGIFMSTMIFSLFSLSNNNLRSIKELFKLYVIVLIVMLVLLNIIDQLGILNYSLYDHIMANFRSLNLKSVMSDRSSQTVIFNNSNIFHILFGEGFGKYSPNNSLATIVQPDASYYRIYNELGLFGFILFFSVFIYFLLKGIKKRDAFLIYLVSFTLVAFYFNRVLWSTPCNYIIFMLLGFSEVDRFKPNKNIVLSYKGEID